MKPYEGLNKTIQAVADEITSETITAQEGFITMTIAPRKIYVCRKCGFKSGHIGVMLNPIVDGDTDEAKELRECIPEGGKKYCYKCWIKSFEGLGELDEVKENIPPSYPDNITLDSQKAKE